MANFKYSIPVQDGDGALSRISGYVVAADIAAATTRIQAVADAADDICLGRIGDNATISAVITLSRTGLKAAATGEADREIKGEFTFTSTTGHKTTISVPTFDKDSHTVSGGNITTGDEGVIDAFVDEIVDNGHADNRFADIIALASAVEAFR